MIGISTTDFLCMCAVKQLSYKDKAKLAQRRKEAGQTKIRDDNARGPQKIVYKCAATNCRKTCKTAHGLKRHIEAHHGRVASVSRCRF